MCTDALSTTRLSFAPPFNSEIDGAFGLLMVTICINLQKCQQLTGENEQTVIRCDGCTVEHCDFCACCDENVEQQDNRYEFARQRVVIL